MNIRASIEEHLSKVLVRLGVAEPKIQLDLTTDLAHGDYATSVSLAYAKEFNMDPRSLAVKIVEMIGTIDGVSKIDIAGPGFINFSVAPCLFWQSLESGRTEPDRWGGNVSLKGTEIMLEYTSPNLFKPLHIGNLVGNVIGESISRLFEFSAAMVHRINYPSDIGLTVAKGVWGLQKTGGDPDDIRTLGDAYRTGNDAYENDPAAKEEINAINKKLYEGTDVELNDLRERGVRTSRARLAEICKALGTSFDTEIFESEAGPVGKGIVLSHIADGIFEVSDGATVFKGESVGLHTRVFLNSAGLPTYEAKDIGNFDLKKRKYPNFDRSYVVTGVEQQEYFKVIIAAIRAVFSGLEGKALGHIATGFLTLTTGKMSSRKGNVLTGEDLLADMRAAAQERASESRAEDMAVLSEQIAVAALKFQILRGGAGKNIVFDRERALSFEGDSGPYLQYAHARTCAIIEKAAASDVVPKFDAATEASDLVRITCRFADIVLRAQEELEPHLIATYLIQLAAAFNSWYAQEQILDGTDKAPHKVAIVDIVRQTLKNGLWLLGIPAPKKM